MGSYLQRQWFPGKGWLSSSLTCCNYDDKFFGYMHSGGEGEGGGEPPCGEAKHAQ